jgi:hypothetical protein
MHTVGILEDALSLARRLNYQIRLEWLGGRGGGCCEFGGKKWLFVDLAQTSAEQLELVLDTLRADPALAELRCSPALASHLRSRRAARTETSVPSVAELNAPIRS